MCEVSMRFFWDPWGLKEPLFWTGMPGGQTHSCMYTHPHTHTMNTRWIVQLALGFPITRSRACSCSSCCCKISNCLCSSSNCRLMYSWRGRQQRIQRNTKRERERKRTGNFKGDKSCQVKCGRKEGKKKIPRHLLTKTGKVRAPKQKHFNAVKGTSPLPATAYRDGSVLCYDSLVLINPATF